MTRELQSTAIGAVVQILAEQGFDGLAEAVEVVLNEAMKIERTRALGAEPYERNSARRGHANGFKPKTVLSRVPWPRRSSAVAMRTCQTCSRRRTSVSMAPRPDGAAFRPGDAVGFELQDEWQND